MTMPEPEGMTFALDVTPVPVEGPIDGLSPRHYEEQARLRLVLANQTVNRRADSLGIIKDSVLGDSNALLAIAGYLREIRDLLKGEKDAPQ
jgi:hypothetical protein